MFWLLVCTAGVTVFTLNSSAPESPLRSDQPQLPVVAGIVESESLKRQPADLELTWGTAPLLYWPGVTGVVTHLPVMAGVVRSGEVVAVINQTPIVALHTPRPLFRDITDGTRGPDVQQLAEELNRLGLLASEDVTDRADWDVRQAIRELNGRAGLDSSVIRSTEVVWLETAEFEIGKVEISVGKPAPSSGETFASGPTPLLRAVATAPEGAPEALEKPLEPTQIRIAGLVVPLNSDLAASDLLAVQSTASSAVDKLNGGVLELVEAVRSWKLPATAVIADSDGTICMVTPSGAIIVVTVIASGPGEVEVLSEPPSEVISNPVASGVATDCG